MTSFSFQDVQTKEIIKQWNFNPSQEKFWKSKAKFLLFSGGRGCGKTTMLVLKAINLSLKYPRNYVLMGRKTYRELQDTLLKEFFDVCPEYFIQDYAKSEGRVVFINKSEIIFRHLDTIAESDIRSLNLGSAFIDQAEDIPEEIFNALRMQLRRNDIEERRIFLSCNPALTWLYKVFKQENRPDFEVVEGSTLENKENLAQEFVDDLLSLPESVKKQFVYGIWDTDLLADRIVFAREYIERLRLGAEERAYEREGLKIYRSFQAGHRYQMGIDAAEGVESGDEAAITIADLTALEEAASWSGRLPPDVVAEYAVKFASWYGDSKNRCLIVPEMNSVGLALVNRLAKEPDLRIYKREEYDKKSGKKLEKLGWRTTRMTKPLLVSRFQELLRVAEPKAHSPETIEQFKTFVWTDVAKKQGMGAETNFHDDRLISFLLAFWEKKPVTPGRVTSPSEKASSVEGWVFSPMFKVREGKVMLRRPMKPLLEIGV